MNPALPPFLRRALALAILLAAAAIVWSAAIWPIVGMVRERRSEIARLSGQIEQYGAIATRAPQLAARARAAQDRLAAAGGLWSGASAAAIAAAAEDYLRKKVSAADGQVTTIAELGESTEHGLRRVRLRFRIEGTLETLIGALAAVESARPALFADSIEMTAPDDGASDRNSAPKLNLDLEISFYRAGEES